MVYVFMSCSVTFSIIQVSHPFVIVITTTTWTEQSEERLGFLRKRNWRLAASDEVDVHYHRQLTHLGFDWIFDSIGGCEAGQSLLSLLA